MGEEKKRKEKSFLPISFSLSFLFFANFLSSENKKKQKN